MSSKQAVYDVLNHRTPEYIPIGLYAVDCDTVQKIIGHETYVRNKAGMQTALWAGKRNEVAQSLKEDSVELFRKLPNIDIIIPYKEAPLLPPLDYPLPVMKKIADRTWEDEEGNIIKLSEITNELSVIKRATTPTLDDYPEDVRAAPPDESIFEAYDHLITEMSPTRFIAGACGVFDVMPMPGGMEEGLAKYCAEPEFIRAALRYGLKRGRLDDPYYIRPGVDEIFVESDFGTTVAPFMSKSMFREFCLPAMTQRVAEIKGYKSKVLFHCCGNTWPLLDMIAESGIDCYQSLQTGAGMDIGPLKAGYGDRLCFWGGVAVENLISGTMEDVRRDVRRAMAEGAPNGGFILGPSHSVAYGTNYDNFMAMLDEHDKLKYNV